MPKGLLDKLTREEILDLIAYVAAKGERKDLLFQGGGQPFRGDRSNGNGFGGPGGQHRAGPRHSGGRPPHGAMPSRLGRRHGPGGRKRQK